MPRAQPRTARWPPSSTLSATPSPSADDRAEQSLGAALRDPARLRLHEHPCRPRRGRGSARDGRASPRSRERPPSSSPSLENACAIRSSDKANVRMPHPSTPIGIDSRIDLRRCRDLRRASPAGRGARQAGSPRSASRARGRARACPACFPEQLCSIARRPGSAPRVPHSRSSSVGRSLREQAAHGRELLGTREMRCAGDRDLDVVEIGARTDEGQSLDRLRRAPEVGDEPRISRSGDDRRRRSPRRREPDVALPRRRRGSPRPRSASRAERSGESTSDD